MKPLLLAGTRPEIIKLWPVYLEFVKRGIAPIWVHSGQHDSMAYPLYEALDITVDHALGLPRRTSNLSNLISLMLPEIERTLERIKPDIVLVQGDTHTVLCGALASYYQDIPIGHVEAGLRTYCLRSPFPEEANRQMAARVATYHFCPTPEAVSNLLEEGIPYYKMFEVGNTIVDAVNIITAGMDDIPGKYIVATLHRRENMEDLPEMLEALERIAIGGTEVFLPVHASPAVSSVVYRKLQGVKGVHLISPMVYPEFIKLLKNAKAIITDSGGVQEEAVTLHKPLVICRDTTERPEAIMCGCGLLAGKVSYKIIHALHEILDKPMPKYSNPFGDGEAAQQIVDVIEREIT